MSWQENLVITRKSGRDLLFSVTKKDLDIQTFRAGGKGGQNQNKRETGVRIVHRDSGAVGESREYRTQEENKRAAFRRLVNSFKFRDWYFHKVQEILSRESVQEWVERQMEPVNLKCEVKVNGRWVEVDPSELTD